MKKIAKFFIVGFVIIFVVNFFYTLLSPPKIAVIEINGIITPLNGSEICALLRKAQKDPSYKAILLKINSPGGDAVQSEKIYELVRRIDKEKPVVALIESIGASGAYYASLGARKIVTYPASLTGSIGVLFEGINAYKLASKVGIEDFVVKSGEFKDVGNPLRKPTQADKEMLFSVIENVYKQFLHAVSSSRHITIQKLQPLADGRVFTGEMALNEHLIDSVGGFEAAKHYLQTYTKSPNLKFVELKNSDNSLMSILGINEIKNLYMSVMPSIEMIYK